VDWETAGAEDPWSNIGYWGDHQIIYLLKLLEAMNDHDPVLIQDMLGAEIFSYAEVPYIIKPYAEILADSRATIVYDTARAERIDERVAKQGSDGKLLTNTDGSVYHANLLEKILLPALSKLSNFIPDAGIWMNTQRPEWNDANNALGGGGISVVTLCYLRRYLTFLADLLAEVPDRQLPVSTEVVAWFAEIETVFNNEVALLATDTMTAQDRRRLMDLLGRAFSAYRETVYADGFTGRQEIAISRVAGLFRTALKFVDRSLAANRRDDGLYHTYNLLEMTSDGTEATVVHLQEMLEGQVAVISSGILEPAETLKVLENLFASAMYRPDQHSFMLYPIPERPGFLTKNVKMPWISMWSSIAWANRNRGSARWPKTGPPSATCSKRSSITSHTLAALESCMATRASVASIGTWWPNCCSRFRKQPCAPSVKTCPLRFRTLWLKCISGSGPALVTNVLSLSTEPSPPIPIRTRHWVPAPSNRA